MDESLRALLCKCRCDTIEAGESQDLMGEWDKPDPAFCCTCHERKSEERCVCIDCLRARLIRVEAALDQTVKKRRSTKSPYDVGGR